MTEMCPDLMCSTLNWYWKLFHYLPDSQDRNKRVKRQDGRGSRSYKEKKRLRKWVYRWRETVSLPDMWQSLQDHQSSHWTSSLVSQNYFKFFFMYSNSTFSLQIIAFLYCSSIHLLFHILEKLKSFQNCFPVWKKNQLPGSERFIGNFLEKSSWWPYLMKNSRLMSKRRKFHANSAERCLPLSSSFAGTSCASTGKISGKSRVPRGDREGSSFVAQSVWSAS